MAYWDRHVETYYVKDGRPTSEQDNIRQALRFLRRLYGDTPGRDFGPLALKAVRQAMIDGGPVPQPDQQGRQPHPRHVPLGRRERAGPRSPSTRPWRRSPGLRKGRSRGHGRRPPVGPVPDETSRRTLPHLSPPVAAMVRLQRLTGMRPGEVAAMRPRDVDRSDPDVLGLPARPAQDRAPRARAGRSCSGRGPRRCCAPGSDRDPDAYCFRPAEAVAARRPGPAAVADDAVAGARRPSPAPEPRPANATRRTATGVAIRGLPEGRACRLDPHQLRHTRATEIRGAYDLEAAQAVLGHSSGGRRRSTPSATSTRPAGSWGRSDSTPAGASAPPGGDGGAPRIVGPGWSGRIVRGREWHQIRRGGTTWGGPARWDPGTAQGARHVPGTLDDRGPEAALPGPDGFEYLAPLESSPSLRAADLGRLLNQLCFDLKASKLTDRDEHRRAATESRRDEPIAAARLTLTTIEASGRPSGTW